MTMNLRVTAGPGLAACAGRWTVVLGAALVLASSHGAAQQRVETSAYARPAESVRELFDRDKSYATLDGVSPDGAHVAVPLMQELSSLERMSRETRRLAMLELRPAVNREWRLDTYGYDRLRIYSMESRSSLDVDLPADTFVSDFMWSPDSSHLAFLAHRPERTEVWTAIAATGMARSVADAAVMATLGRRPARGSGPTSSSRILQWTPDGHLIALLVPENRGPEPQPGPVSRGPIVWMSRDEPSPTRTLRFLLINDHDKALFRYYTTAQIAELAPGQTPRPIGDPGMFLELSLSSDGDHLLTERIVDPLSTVVGYSSFPRRLEVRSLDGRAVSIIRDVPLNEDASRRTVQLEAELPRDVAWLPGDNSLGFVWREPKPRGESSDADAPRRDRLMRLEAPFGLDAADVVVETDEPGDRFADVRFARDARFAFATIRSAGENGASAKTRIVAYTLDEAPPAAHIVADAFDPDDPLDLPGTVLTRVTGNGVPYAVVSSGGDAAYLQGAGYRTDLRPRPFIDRVTISTAVTERVFESAPDRFGRPLVALDQDLERIIIGRESKSEFPDSYLWSRDGSAERLTDNQDPFPEITAARRIDFFFTRQDGLDVRARISLPVGYESGTRVPAIFWTYPREYGSVEEYERATTRARNENAFTHLSYLRWSDIWLSQGYALIYPDVPIIRKGGSFNDNYIQHLVDSLYGAIRAVDRMGYVDIDRIGHGGHSYGAFATANLLAHSPFFKAGIAGDGAYNRSLTPMGFQSERRHLWEAPDVYLEMSPFFDADHIDTPLLMYHGQDDNNSGTFPIQSERLMQVLLGLGKTAALYVYPYESHAPRAKESYLDLWSRWLDWFDRYVKQPPTPESSLP